MHVQLITVLLPLIGHVWGKEAGLMTRYSTGTNAIVGSSSIMPHDGAWVELKTKFTPVPGTVPKYPPRTIVDALSKGWTQIGDGCTSDDSAWPGKRLIPPQRWTLDIPDMVLIYDADGNVAGMQSGLPSREFLNEGACPDSPYYQQQTINGVEFCLATMYFTDPADICQSGNKKDVLVFQEGATYKDANKLLSIPSTWSETQSNAWVREKFYPGMGHHVFPYETKPENCQRLKPFQILYAKTDYGCVNTGFVWTHFTTTTNDDWEKPPPIFPRLILYNPMDHMCMNTMTLQGKFTAMHVWLGGSAAPCESSNSLY